MLVRAENRSNKVIIFDFTTPVRCDIYQTLDFRMNNEELEKFKLYLKDLCLRLELSYKENKQKIGEIEVIIFILR